MEKQALFNNFFKSYYLVKIFEQQKLFQFKFFFKSEYDLQFFGAGRSSKTQEQARSVSTKLNPATDSEKEQLETREAQRREAGRLSRAYEKNQDSLDPQLYAHLKEIRVACNALYFQQQKLQDSMSQDQSRLYILNKKIHGQPVVSSKPTPIPLSFKPTTKIYGIDPGVVTMASGVCSSHKEISHDMGVDVRFENCQASQYCCQHHGIS
ncbi:hypothetical protein [Parasitella parasitica]|uniref:Uncharacterized protein n=1 Tax=Parasitella parasitica TaxID=35722 RepID=A0A0B7NH63_9FUNG|nr:hypothetical protein [Parasitella parasitica]